MTIRYASERTKTNRILDLTSLTEDEFTATVVPFETAFQTRMRDWRLDGLPRTGRSYTQYANCPVPSPEDRLLFILLYLKQAPTQVLHGVLFGMGQPKANQWIQTLMIVLQATLASTGDLPSRTRAALQERLAQLSTASDTPPFCTTAAIARLSGPPTRLNKPAIIAARKSATP